MINIKLLKEAQYHLKNNNMTYIQHWKFAVGHGLLCLKAGLLLIVHGFMPCFFQRSGSILVRILNKSFDQHKKDGRKCK